MCQHLHTLQDIKRRIRQGDAPKDIAGAIPFDFGAHRAAYSVGPFVVKQSDTVPCSNPACNDADCWACNVSAGRGLPIRKAPTVRVEAPNGTWYDVQLRYAPLALSWDEWEETPERRDSQHFDLHARNVGLDRRGRFVAFDWVWAFAIALGSMVSSI